DCWQISRRSFGSELRSGLSLALANSRRARPNSRSVVNFFARLNNSRGSQSNPLRMLRAAITESLCCLAMSFSPMTDLNLSGAARLLIFTHTVAREARLKRSCHRGLDAAKPQVCIETVLLNESVFVTRRASLLLLSRAGRSREKARNRGVTIAPC